MILTIALFFTVLLAIAASWLLRGLGVPGHRVLGGLLVGLLLGPSVLGRIAPEPWEKVMIGGLETRQALTSLDRQHAAWLVAAQTAGPPAEQIAEQTSQHERDRSDLQRSLENTRSIHQRPWLLAILGLGVFTTLIGVSCGTSRKGPTLNPSGIPIGTWSAAIPALGIMVLGAGMGMDALAGGVIATAACLAIGPWSDEPFERWILRKSTGDSPSLMSTAARAATCVAIALCLLYTIRNGQTIGWFLVGMAALGLLRFPVATSSRRWFRHLRDHACLPALAALSIIFSEVILDARWLPIIVVTVLAGDGRWLGSAIALWMRPGTRGMPAMRSAMMSVDIGGPQLVMTATATTLGILDPSWTVALLIAVLVVELSVPGRRSLNRYFRSEVT